MQLFHKPTKGAANLTEEDCEHVARSRKGRKEE